MLVFCFDSTAGKKETQIKMLKNYEKILQFN